MNTYGERQYCYGCEANVVCGYSLCEDCENELAEHLIDELWDNRYLLSVSHNYPEQDTYLSEMGGNCA